jgi:hypothetical protein
MPRLVVNVAGDRGYADREKIACVHIERGELE